MTMTPKTNFQGLHHGGGRMHCRHCGLLLEWADEAPIIKTCQIRREPKTCRFGHDVPLPCEHFWEQSSLIDGMI